MSGIVDSVKGIFGGVDAPDPGATAATQGNINKQAIYDSAAINQINQMGPGYSINWSGEVGDPNRTMTYSLDPYREQLAQLMGQRSLDQSQLIGGPIDYSGVRGIPSTVPAMGDYSERAADVESTMYDALMSRINPDMQRAWDQQTTLAANKGLPMGGEAWNDVQESLNRQYQDTAMGAAGQAIGLGRDESDRLFRQQMAENQRVFGQDMAARQQGMQDIGFDRNQLMNEYAMMLNANPYNTAQIQTPTQYQISPADYMGAEMAKYQGNVAGRGSMLGGLSQLGSSYIMGSMMS